MTFSWHIKREKRNAMGVYGEPKSNLRNKKYTITPELYQLDYESEKF